MNRSVSDLLKRGGSVIYTAPYTTVAEAARTMAERNISSILVLENGREIVGIFTERDLLRRVIVKGLDPKETKVQEVMTRDVMVITANAPRAEALRVMNEHHIRHLPVADEDNLLGVISLRDLLRYEVEEKDFEIEQLRDYVLRRPYPSYPG